MGARAEGSAGVVSSSGSCAIRQTQIRVVATSSLPRSALGFRLQMVQPGSERLIEGPLHPPPEDANWKALPGFLRLDHRPLAARLEPVDVHRLDAERPAGPADQARPLDPLERRGDGPRSRLP